MHASAARGRRRLAALLSLVPAGLPIACASGGGGPAEPPPSFTRWRPYAPEDLSRQVVECSEQARLRLAADETRWDQSDAELRRALYRETSACMERWDWRRG